MRRMIEIRVMNNNSRKNYPLGTSLKDILKDQHIELKHKPLGALVNNRLEELWYEIYKPKTILFIDISHIDGFRMYVRSLSFVIQKAVKDLFPDKTLKIEHSVSKGLYCEIEGWEGHPEFDDIYRIRNRMQEIVDKDIPFRRTEIPTEEAIEVFKKNDYLEKAKLFKTRPKMYTSIYYLDELEDYFYGYLVPSTGYLQVFDLVKYYDGMLLMLPKREKPDELEDIVLQEKMFEIFREYKSWGKILGIGTIGSINQVVIDGKAGELIKVSEALQEKKVALIADEIYKKRENTRLVLISGPSSSGKTTFSKRLAIQLKVAGLKPVQISLDNYFVEREKTPKDERGRYNFEILEALDIKLFNQHLVELINGKQIRIPKFSFETGKRFYHETTVKISDEHIILIEGIHALNPELTPLIDNQIKFKIYVSALTQVGIDGHNRIPTTDNRLIRRIVRDAKYRNYSALETLRRWESVRQGENLFIFPFQEEADIMFNSALPFELGVLKCNAEPLLKEVPQTQIEYAEAKRLLKFLSYFQPIYDKEIPPTSILREFLGKSSFRY